MTNNTNMYKTMDLWAENVIKAWKTKIIALRIKGTNNLFNSFYHHIKTNANGDPVMIEFAFNYYGKFLDMGVGKGVTLENRDHLKSLGLTTRAQKEWYSKIFFAETQRLKDKLANAYADQAELIIKTNLESFDTDENKVNSKSSRNSSNLNKAARDYDRARGR